METLLAQVSSSVNVSSTWPLTNAQVTKRPDDLIKAYNNLTHRCLDIYFSGRGGASIFGKQFEDELHPELKFTGK